MNIKHTPGPWKYAAAAAYNAPNYYVIHAGRPSFGSTPLATVDSETDARLIAAAPDMLAALQALLKASEEWTGELRDTHPVRIRARAAIAKATSEG